MQWLYKINASTQGEGAVVDGLDEFSRFREDHQVYENFTKDQQRVNFPRFGVTAAIAVGRVETENSSSQVRPMKTMPISLLLATVLTPFAALPAIAQTQMLQFQCANGGAFVAQVQKDEAKVQFASGERKSLLPVDSHTGRKFSDGRILLYVNGTEAWVEVAYNRVYQQCNAQQSPSTLSSNQ
ncbi:MAG: hypothetical protein NW220_03775 [Leptolyngbyaceae cyanobacterium bins.349]|nr:hypothetical protein [Leptolyngbyaceae cyanobacterium bins.349]